MHAANCLNFGEGEDGGKIVTHPGEYWMRLSFSMHDHGTRLFQTREFWKLSFAHAQ